MQSSAPLARPCKFWFQNSHEKADFKHSLHPIAVVKTLEDFWAYYQYLRRPSSMEESKLEKYAGHNLYLFEDGIEPMWEDKHNASGGALSLMFEKSKSDRVWEDLLLAFISDSSEDARSINGIRLKIRKDIASLEVWTSVKIE